MFYGKYWVSLACLGDRVVFGWCWWCLVYLVSLIYCWMVWILCRVFWWLCLFFMGMFDEISLLGLVVGYVVGLVVGVGGTRWLCFVDDLLGCVVIGDDVFGDFLVFGVVLFCCDVMRFGCGLRLV